jgi:alkanesulfonate monooxygenase SsuD/methylene tetrahydromethanopterin reductase-like flavin-dependent oxidoreductase (luciferase family)
VGGGSKGNEAEFQALGVLFHERGARTTEYLRIWQACWAPDKVSFDGKLRRGGLCAGIPEAHFAQRYGR